MTQPDPVLQPPTEGPIQLALQLLQAGFHEADVEDPLVDEGVDRDRAMTIVQLMASRHQREALASGQRDMRAGRAVVHPWGCGHRRNLPLFGARQLFLEGLGRRPHWRRRTPFSPPLLAALGAARREVRSRLEDLQLGPELRVAGVQ